MTPRLAAIAGLALVALAATGLSVSQYLASRAGTALQSGVVGNAAPSVDAIVPSDASGTGSVALPAPGFTLNEGAPRTLYVRGTVSDPNGCADVNGVNLTVYRPGVAFGGTDGMNASGELGQADFTHRVANYEGSVTAKGMGYSNGVAVDNVGRRLFVSDWGNKRVLEYDLNADGTPVDATADHVLGQASLNLAVAAITSAGMGGPTGLAWDAANSRLFVADGSNNRVLTFDLAGGLTSGMAATHVLGQADLTHGAVNRGGAVGPGTMSYPSGLLWNAAEGRLLVSDRDNNRILSFDLSAGVTDGMAATHVLGQADLTHNAANRGGAVGAGTLNLPFGLAWDAVNARLIVVDMFNSRVLFYDLTGGLADGMAATHVLGQADFMLNATNRGAAVSALSMYWPVGLAWDVAGSRLLVSDGNNQRVLIFDLAAGVTDGMAASHVLGQADFTHNGMNRAPTGTGTPAANSLIGPGPMTMDPSHNRLFLADTSNYRVLYFSLDANAACAPDANNCYFASVAKGALAGCTGAGDTDATFEATIPMANYADPTDAGSPYAFESWRASAVVTDAAGVPATLAADFNIQSLAAFSVAPSLMDYGTIALGATSAQQALTFTNVGNRSINSLVRADGAMHSSLAGFADVPSAQTHYSTAPAAAWTAGTPVAATDSDVPLALPQQQADAGPAPTVPAYFYLKLPATGIRGTYTNTLFFTAYAR